MRRQRTKALVASIATQCWAIEAADDALLDPDYTMKMREGMAADLQNIAPDDLPMVLAMFSEIADNASAHSAARIRTIPRDLGLLEDDA